MTVIVTDYGGRAPDLTVPFGGVVQAWDLDTQTYHDYRTGVDVERPFTPEEDARFADLLLRWQIQRALDAIDAALPDLRVIRQEADADIAVAVADRAAVNALAAQADTLAAQTTLWTVARQQQVAAGIATLARLVADVEGWRIRADRGISMLAGDMVDVARAARQTVVHIEAQRARES